MKSTLRRTQDEKPAAQNPLFGSTGRKDLSSQDKISAMGPYPQCQRMPRHTCVQLLERMEWKAFAITPDKSVTSVQGYGRRSGQVRDLAAITQQADVIRLQHEWRDGPMHNSGHPLQIDKDRSG